MRGRARSCDTRTMAEETTQDRLSHLERRAHAALERVRACLEGRALVSETDLAGLSETLQRASAELEAGNHPRAPHLRAVPNPDEDADTASTDLRVHA